MSPSRSIALAVLLLLAACATREVADTEQMLAAAGFTTQPAVTPALQALPPHQLVVRAAATAGAVPSYAYADPDQCHCVYVGGPSQYQYFQQLAVQKRIADEQMNAAMMNENAAFNLATIPQTVVVVHERR